MIMSLFRRAPKNLNRKIVDAVLDAAGAFAGEPGLRAALEQAAHDWPDWRSRRLADGAGGDVGTPAGDLDPMPVQQRLGLVQHRL